MDKQKDGKAKRQMDKRKDVLSNKQTNVQLNKQTNRHTGKQFNNNKWTDGETDRQTFEFKEKWMDLHKVRSIEEQLD